MQLGNGGQGYIGVTVQVTATPANLLTLVNNLLTANGLPPVPPDYREYQIQIDPEGTSNTVRIGSASVGAAFTGLPSNSAAVTVVQSAAHTTSDTVTFTSNVTAGNLIVIFASRNNGLNNPCNPSDTLSNTWTQVIWSGAGGGGFPNQMACCWAVAKSTGACTVTVSTASCVAGIELANATSTVDASGAGTGTAAPSLTASKSGDALLTGLIATTSNNPSVTGPEVILQTVHSLDGGNIAAFAFTTVPSTGSVASSLVPGSGSSNQTYVSVLFEAAAMTPAQKGLTLSKSGMTTVNSAVLNGAYFGSLYAQAVGGDQTVNISLWMP